MSKHHTTVSSAETAEMLQLNLKNRALAALLAWLVPGLGHLYQGRTAKGLLFMICLVSTFAFGFYVGEGRVAYASAVDIRQAPLGYVVQNYPVIFQSGIGAVAIPMAVERGRARAKPPRAPLFGEAFRPPALSADLVGLQFEDAAGNPVRPDNELAKWHYRLGAHFELGTVYTMIAGLLNLLVIYDAYSGPLLIRPQAATDPDDGGSDTGQGDPPDA